ncbi:MULTISPECIES: aspartate:alanine exchanger family transporter [unclassified Virgibacillus]|uniref:aspartate:alanine exchanger family transporter n=1 Tax=unclassified Virgibacillus TaxID=2620237 RepID=UPI00090AB983|nr:MULTISPECIES: TrkA C-terminal domain-containing protein [unclassified Virgibacillus]API93291.1 YidE/YbjL duplication [Virgibacillus sp. 6R]MBS7428660.1 YidE/YbjL duplication [Virgibacillus sp. 19R1-5]
MESLLHDLLNEQLILVFAILLIGSFLGQIKLKGLSFGSAGVLLVAMVFGHFGYQVSPIIQNLGLSLFIVAIGLQAGPRFFRMIRSNGIIFCGISLFIVTSAVVTTVIVAKFFDLSAPLSVGLMTGALTSTPGLAAALQATNDPITSVGYGIGYPFGVLAIILFVQLLPRFSKVDLIKDLEETNNPIKNEHSPEVMSFKVTNPNLHKRTLKELAVSKKDVVISRIIRNGHTMIALSDTPVLMGDSLVTVGEEKELKSFGNFVGLQVNTQLENPDNIQFKKVTVEDDTIVGKSIKELKLRKKYGATVTRIEREGLELNQHPNMRLLRGDVLTIVSTEDRLNQVAKLFSRKNMTVTNVHIFSISITLLLGIIVGMLPIYIPGLGTIKLGIAGGPLFVALIIGHFGNIGPIHVRYYAPANHVIRELGLVLFLAGAGTTAGHGLVSVIQTEGIKLAVGGTIITLVPIFFGYVAAKKLFKLSIVHSLGSLCGGRTSTPALGALNQVVDSDDAIIAYAAAYPFSLIFVAISTQLMMFFL